MLLHLFANMPRLSNVQRAHWEVGRELAGRLGLGPSVQTLFDQIYERWDERGNPGGQRGDTTALPVHIVHVAHSAETVVHYGVPFNDIADAAEDRLGRVSGYPSFRTAFLRRCGLRL